MTHADLLRAEIAAGATLALQIRTQTNQLFAAYWSARGCNAHLNTVAADGMPQRRLDAHFRQDIDVGQVLNLAMTHSAPLQLGSVEITATGFSIPAAALRTQVIAALAELLRIPLPDPATLKAEQRARSEQRKAERAARAEAKLKAAQRAEARRQRELAERTPAHPVTDAASLIAALPVRLKDSARLSKALAMLKSEGFQLFHEVASDAIAGVVRSQSGNDLVYACRLAANGDVSCCTQNLNVCGGLRGEACKHLLVLLIGLARAGAVDAATVDSWLAAGLQRKPVLDRELMAEVFLRYHGATAGELDWRPTTTLPEDFLAY